MEEGEIDLSNLPKDVDKLQVLVSDLSRRLQNALHMVDAQKLLVQNATNTSELLRNRVNVLSQKLRLEQARNETFHKQKVKQEESVRYEKLKKTAGQLHEELRMAVLDHSMKFTTKKEPEKISKMRKKLDDIEIRQESQKQVLQQISVEDQMLENLANACQHGNIEAVHSILRKGVNLNEIDSAGFLPIHYSSANGHDTIVRLLLEYGSDVSSFLSGYSPLILAAQNGHSHVVSVLIEFGADVEDKGKGGCPPIVAAASHCHRGCIETLLEHGANVNSFDLNGNTALHTLAKQKEPISCMQLLLMYGADTNIQNGQGYTPLQLALSIMNTVAIGALHGEVDVKSEGRDDPSISSSIAPPSVKPLQYEHKGLHR